MPEREFFIPWWAWPGDDDDEEEEEEDGEEEQEEYVKVEEEQSSHRLSVLPTIRVTRRRRDSVT